MSKIVLVVIAATGLASGDWYLRNWEMSWLLVAVEKSEAALEDAGEAVASAARADQPGLARSRAVASARHIADTGDAVGQVFLLPWHFAEREAQLKFLDHSMAWVNLMKAVAAGQTNVGQESIAISETFVVAHRRFERAVPIAPLFNIDKRVADVFDE